MAFNWSGVVVGHWLVGDRVGSGYRTRLRSLYRCVSKCGVHSSFTASALSAGATLSCEACRGGPSKSFLSVVLTGKPGVAPPPARVVPEPGLAAHQSRWHPERIVQIDYRAVKGTTARDDFEAHAAPILRDVLARTNLGLDWGWQVFVQQVHGQMYDNQKPKQLWRYAGNTPGQRRIDAKVFPCGGKHWFEVSIQTGRTGQWDATVAQVQAAGDEVNRLYKLAFPHGGDAAHDDEPGGNGKAAAVVTHPAPFTKPTDIPAAANGAAVPAADVVAALGDGVERLTKMRGGLDRVIAVAMEAKAGAEIKAELERRLADADAVYHPVRARQRVAVSTADGAARHLTECTAAVRAAREAMEKAENELAWATANEETARNLAAALTDEVAPLERAVEEIKAELAEAERMDKERIASLGNANAMAGLLAALERLG